MLVSCVVGRQHHVKDKVEGDEGQVDRRNERIKIEWIVNGDHVV